MAPVLHTTHTTIPPMAMTRIALIHALSHSLEPINRQLAQDWPEAVRMNLLDDSLSADLAANGTGLDATMHQRFEDLAAYAVATGADAILFTCSAFGPCIEAVAQRWAPIPVLKPNEAMIDDAARLLAATPAGRLGRLGLLATFEPTLQSMPPEFPASVPLLGQWVPGALEALNQGDGPQHDQAIVQAAVALAQQGVSAIALAQFSMARAKPLVEKATHLPVLTTPSSAVDALRRRLHLRAG